MLKLTLVYATVLKVVYTGQCHVIQGTKQTRPCFSGHPVLRFPCENVAYPHLVDSRRETRGRQWYTCPHPRFFSFSVTDWVISPLESVHTEKPD